MLRLDPGGADHAHLHLAARDQVQVVVQALADGDDRVLGRAVRRHARRADQPRDGRGVDDVPLALREHARHERADAVDDAPEVDARAIHSQSACDSSQRRRRPRRCRRCCRRRAPRRTPRTCAWRQRLDGLPLGHVGRTAMASTPRRPNLLARCRRAAFSSTSARTIFMPSRRRSARPSPDRCRSPHP